MIQKGDERSFTICHVDAGTNGKWTSSVPIYIDWHCADNIRARTGYKVESFTCMLNTLVKKCPDFGRLMSMAYDERYELEKQNRTHIDVKVTNVHVPNTWETTDMYICFSFNKRGAAVNTVLLTRDIARGYRGTSEIAFFVHEETLCFTIDDNGTLKKGISNALVRNRIKNCRQD